MGFRIVGHPSLDTLLFSFSLDPFPPQSGASPSREVKKEMLDLWSGYQVNSCGDLHLNCPSAWRPDLCPARVRPTVDASGRLRAAGPLTAGPAEHMYFKPSSGFRHSVEP